MRKPRARRSRPRTRRRVGQQNAWQPASFQSERAASASTENFSGEQLLFMMRCRQALLHRAWHGWLMEHRGIDTTRPASIKFTVSHGPARNMRFASMGLHAAGAVYGRRLLRDSIACWRQFVKMRWPSHWSSQQPEPRTDMEPEDLHVSKSRTDDQSLGRASQPRHSPRSSLSSGRQSLGRTADRELTPAVNSQDPLRDYWRPDDNSLDQFSTGCSRKQPTVTVAEQAKQQGAFEEERGIGDTSSADAATWSSWRIDKELYPYHAGEKTLRRRRRLARLRTQVPRQQPLRRGVPRLNPVGWAVSGEQSSLPLAPSMQQRRRYRDGVMWPAAWADEEIAKLLYRQDAEAIRYFGSRLLYVAITQWCSYTLRSAALRRGTVRREQNLLGMVWGRWRAVAHLHREIFFAHQWYHEHHNFWVNRAVLTRWQRQADEQGHIRAQLAAALVLGTVRCMHRRLREWRRHCAAAKTRRRWAAQLHTLRHEVLLRRCVLVWTGWAQRAALFGGRHWISRPSCSQSCGDVGAPHGEHCFVHGGVPRVVALGPRELLHSSKGLALLALCCWWTYNELRRNKHLQEFRLRQLCAGALCFAAFQAWQQRLAGGEASKCLMTLSAASCGKRMWRRRIYVILEPQMVARRRWEWFWDHASVCPI